MATKNRKKTVEKFGYLPYHHAKALEELTRASYGDCADAKRAYDETEANFKDAYHELESKMFEWVLGQTEDPEPDIGYQTPELYHAVAEKAYELIRWKMKKQMYCESLRMAVLARLAEMCMGIKIPIFKEQKNNERTL